MQTLECQAETSWCHWERTKQDFVSDDLGERLGIGYVNSVICEYTAGG